jgi:hypothetical protein
MPVRWRVYGSIRTVVSGSERACQKTFARSSERREKRDLQTHPIDFALALDGDHAGAGMMRRCRPDRSRRGRISSRGIVSWVQKCVSVGGGSRNRSCVRAWSGLHTLKSRRLEIFEAFGRFKMNAIAAK